MIKLDRRSTLSIGFAGCAALLLARVGPALAGAVEAASADNDGRRDFDFLVGDWTVAHRSLSRGAWVSSAGTCAMHPLMGGLANLDDNRIVAASGAFHGATLRLFDPGTRLWSIYWVDSRAPQQIGPPVVGAFARGVGTFEGDDHLDGKPIRVRFTWSDITAAGCRWRQAYSTDGGRTWEENWIMDFSRVRP